jgi:hypothetical protein
MELKQLRYEADHSSPSAVAVRMSAALLALPDMALWWQSVTCTFTLCDILGHSKLVKW